MHLELVDVGAGEGIWRALEATARPTYFLTWGWIESWLAMLPAADRPQLAVVRDRGAAVAAWFLARRRIVRHHVLPIETAVVNATGVTRYDELCIEHNGVLAAPGTAWTVARVVELVPACDELVLPGIDRARLPDGTLPDGHRIVVDREVPSPVVELDRVRAAGDYLELLSANTRSQIRRARRRVGATELEVASSLPQALAIYDELVALHAASWLARGEPGAFADPWFDRFHRRLIARRFGHGEIQLVRLRAGGATLGCLYNLVANGRVLFYQSGFAPAADAAVKPGLLAHAAAIAHCAATGATTYDLLGGNARYKRSLATAATPLAWLRVQRTCLRFAIEDRVRAWRHALA